MKYASKYMKIFFLIVVLFSIIETRGQTQNEENIQAFKELRSSEKLMNDIFKKILVKYSDDTLFIKNFRQSQKIWKRFEEAQVKALYPDYPAGRYGSMLPLCVAIYRKKLVTERSRDIQKWLTGSEEGDCYSSIKDKTEIIQSR